MTTTQAPPVGVGEKRRVAAVGAGLLACVLFVAAMVHDLPHFVYDDGGITLRYAQHVAQGAGLTYNPGERVNGCSNPLYTLVIAGLLRLGAAPATAVQLVGSVALAASAGVLVFVLARSISVGAALVALALLTSNPFLFYSLFNGLETPLTALLTVLLFSAMQARREAWCGVVLGLLVCNKLDGGLAAIAYAVATLATSRRFPVRAAAVASLTALPMAVWLTLRFGTPFPNSMLVKVGSHTSESFSSRWVLGKLRWNAPWPLLLASSAIAIPVRMRGPDLVPSLTILVWLVLHIGVYSVVDLGAPTRGTSHRWSCIS